MELCKCNSKKEKKENCNLGRDLLILLGAGVVAGVVAVAVVNKLAQVDYENFDEDIELSY